MADDHRKRPTPAAGIPSRPITERGTRQFGDRNERRQSQPYVSARIEDETTPVTMIRIVREELKDDIKAVDDKVDAMGAKVESLDSSLNSAVQGMAKLTGEVSVTNKLLPQMLETIRDELRSRRAVDEQVVMSRVEVNRHREITAIDTDAVEKRAKTKAKLKVIGAITAPAVIGALLTYLATHC